MPRNFPDEDRFGGPFTPRELEALEERLDALENTLRELQRKHGPKLLSLFGELITPEVRGHLRAANRERLLATRSFLDALIKRMEDAPEADARMHRPESVHIE